MGEIVLIRHGETKWSKTGQHTSTTDLQLTEVGAQQAQGIAQLLRHWDIRTVWSSPRTRAINTAELSGLTIDRIRPDLAEWAYGDAEGKTRQQIDESDPGWSLWADGGIGPGGETVESVTNRVDRLLAEAEPLLESGDVALVSHGHLCRVIAARWIGLEAGAGMNFSIGTAAVAGLGYEYDERSIGLWNLTPRLLGPPPTPSSEPDDWGGDNAFGGDVA
ncbi:histidine phosphatase family protein [Haloglycomyces albus]|uniref:histidine phosphatase family protein n=1 Tax=Haloglycomyces albus TaxID=526067 RepID=UPI00046D5C3E|nr:histidine phosphatase family protein [Haloglycomyces albus]